MKRDTVTAYRRRAADTERRVDDAVAAVKAERDAVWAEARAACAADEAARHKFTRDELAGAVAVRLRDGWRPVVRVNAQSVTVRTAYSWDERVPFGKVLEMKRGGELDSVVQG